MPASAEPIMVDPDAPPVESFERPLTPQRIPELEQAVLRFGQKRYDEALELLRAARKKNAELPPAHAVLAELFFSSNQSALGYAVLEQAVAEHPDYPGIYVLSAMQAHGAGRRADAVVLYDKAEQLAKAEKWTDKQRRDFSLRCHTGRALIAEERGHWQAAADALGAWLELEPNNGRTRERLARALFFLDKQKEAHAQLQQARQDDPNLKSAEITMGLLYMEQGNLDKAARWMQAAVKRAPDDPRAQLELGNCLLKQGQEAQATACAEAAAKLDPGRRELKILRGLIALATKDYEEAERQYLAVLHDFPEDDSARDKLALALAQQQSEEKQRRAMQLAQMNVRLHPNAAWPLATAGWVSYRLGRHADAERTLRAAVSRRDAKPDSAYYLARVLADQGRNDEARQLLEQALASPIVDFIFRKEAERHLDQLTKASP